MKNQKITLEEFKTKEIKYISIKTERREYTYCIDKYISTYDDRLLVASESMSYTKEQFIVEEGCYLTASKTEWTCSTYSPEKMILFRQLLKEVMELLTSPEDEEVSHPEDERTYFSIVFKDETSIEKSCFVSKEKKFNKIIEIIKSLVPAKVEIPMICEEKK